MITEDIKNLIIRDLNKLNEELSLFQEEKNIWKTVDNITNSAGHLTLHICGNLRHFIGHILGGSAFIRNRENEFNSSPVLLEILTSEILSAKEEVAETLDSFTLEKLNSTYPINVFNKEMTAQFFLIHLHGHLTYHIGQINYLRRSLS